MPTNVRIINTQDFVRASLDGTLDRAASRELLTGIIAELGPAGNYGVLIDTRNADLRLATWDIFDIAVAVAEEPTLSRRKVGLLVPLEEDAEARFFETVGRNRGAEVRGFTDFESAITWLIMSN